MENKIFKLSVTGLIYLIGTAVKEVRVDILSNLIKENGLDINNYVKEADKAKLFTKAVKTGDEFFLEKLNYVEFKDELDLDKLFKEAVKTKKISIIEKLLKAGANINDGKGRALRLAALDNDYTLVDFLINHGASVRTSEAVVTCWNRKLIDMAKHLYKYDPSSKLFELDGNTEKETNHIIEKLNFINRDKIISLSEIKNYGIDLTKCGGVVCIWLAEKGYTDVLKDVMTCFNPGVEILDSILKAALLKKSYLTFYWLVEEYFNTPALYTSATNMSIYYAVDDVIHEMLRDDKELLINGKVKRCVHNESEKLYIEDILFDYGFIK